MTTAYNREVLQSVLDTFLVCEEKDEDIIMAVVEEPVSTVVEEPVDTKCITGCKKKCRMDCIHK